MSDFELHTLGSLWAGRADDEGPAFQGGKACLLVAVLASRRYEWTDREYLSQLLWPSTDDGRRHHSLRQLLSSIRRALSPDALEEGVDGVRLNLHRWWVDCLEFEQALKEGRWVDAARLYRGPFGGEHEPNGGIELRAVIDSIQARLHAEAVDCLSRVISRALDDGRVRDAETWARHLVAVDPLNETARGFLIQALLAADRQSDALGTFEEYRILIGELIGDVPSENLRELAQELRAHTGHVRHPHAHAAEAPPEAESTTLIEEPDEHRSAARWTIGTMVAVAAVFVALLVLERGPSGNTSSQDFTILAGVLGEHGDRSTVRLALGPSGVRSEATPTPVGLVDPTGRFIADGLTVSDGFDLEVRSVEDRSVVVRRSGPLDDMPLAWAPDGSALLYKSTILADGNTGSLERFGVVSVPDGTVRPFGSFEPTTVQGAAWSPKGTLVAISASTGADHDLYVLSANGELRTHLASLGDQRWPVWSPSGEWLAFESEIDGASKIQLMAPSDPAPRPLENSPVPQWAPVWLADTLLAFLQGRAVRTELRLINPFSGTGSRALAVHARLVDLGRDQQRVTPGSWVDRVAATPDRLLASRNEQAVVQLSARNDLGRPVEVEPAALRWTSSDTGVVQVEPSGEIRTLGTGHATVTASLEGWRSVDIPVDVRPLVEQEAEPLLQEDWVGGIRDERWVVYGNPSPYTRQLGCPEGGGVFISNGDGNHNSGVISRRALDLSDGLTVEFLAAQPISGQYFQDIQVSLDRVVAVRADGELVEQHTIAWYRTNGFQRSASVRVGETEPLSLPLPTEVDDWHRYALQVERSGLVTMVVDGEPAWRGRSPYGITFPDSAFLNLGGRSVGTEILLGTVTVYRGARYRVAPDG